MKSFILVFIVVSGILFPIARNATPAKSKIEANLLNIETEIAEHFHLARSAGGDQSISSLNRIYLTRGVTARKARIVIGARLINYLEESDSGQTKISYYLTSLENLKGQDWCHEGYSITLKSIHTVNLQTDPPAEELHKDDRSGWLFEKCKSNGAGYPERRDHWMLGDAEHLHLIVLIQRQVIRVSRANEFLAFIDNLAEPVGQPT